MNYNVKGTGLQVSDEIRTYIEKRLVQAEKFLKNDPTAHSDVEVEYRASEDRKFRAEFTLSSEAKVYRAEAQGDTLHEAIDIAINELTQELRRTKQKKLDLFRRGASKLKDYFRRF